MSRPMQLGLGVAAALALLPATAQAKYLYSVAAGDPTSNSAILWASPGVKGSVTLEVTSKGKVAARHRLSSTKRNDYVVQRKVTRLKAGTTYSYRFTGPGRLKSPKGTFETAPAASRDATVRFTWTGDADPVKSGGKLFFAPFDVYRRMASRSYDFAVNLGDTIYSDTDSKFADSDPVAVSLAAKRKKYRDILSAKNLQKLRSTVGMYNHWDDHEFLNDFARAQTKYPVGGKVLTVDGNKLYRDGARAFRDYMPVTYSSSNGIYRKVRWGKNLEVFLLDQRSFRDAGADDGGTCDNPAGSGKRDLAPMVPQRLRNTFALLVPAFSTPPPKACIDRLNDPNRTYLGKRQLERFQQDILTSTATFKVVLNEMPIQQLFFDPYDRWEGFEAERKALVNFLRTRVKNVVFVSTDVHATFANDVRLETFPEQGGPIGSGIIDVSTGPAGTDTGADDFADDTGNKDAGPLAASLFFSKNPPDGPGAKCNQLDTFSFGRVTVTATQLTIDVLDSKGQQVKSFDGKPCGPYVVTPGAYSLPG